MKKLVFALVILLLVHLSAGCSEIDEDRDIITGGVTEKAVTEDLFTGEEETEIEETEFSDETETTAEEVKTEDSAEIKTENISIENISDETEKAEEELPDETKTSEQTPPETESQPLSDITGYMNIGESGILVAEINGRIHALMPCWGTYTLCDLYAKSMNEFAAELPEVNVYSMIVPTSVEFYLPPGNEGFSSNQLIKINYITEELKNVTNVDAYGALRRYMNEYIYMRTDHHWQPLGAYYAAEAFSEVADFPFLPLEEYREVVRSGYVGSMYNYTQDENLLNDPDDFIMYIPPEQGTAVYYDEDFQNGYESALFLSPDGSNYYCSFLGSDRLIAEIKTNAGTGRTLVIFKESYGNAVVPFLLSGFDTIYVCDIRYFNLNAVKFCMDVGATDLLFSVCTFTCAGDNAKYLGIIKQQ